MLDTRRGPTPRSSLESYFRDINETPLLSASAEHELAERVSAGDPQAREHMVQANLRLVVRIARDFAGRGLALDDLIAEGNLGLMRAVEAFDPSLNTRFSTYAAYWIRQSIERALDNQSRPIRLPAYMIDLMTRWRRAAVVLQEEFGRPATEDEIAVRLELRPKQLKIIRKAIRIYNASPAPDRGGEESLVDVSSEGPGFDLARSDDLEQVLRLIDGLDERSANVLRLRFGLSGDEPMTLTQIGARLHLTRERVRQIEKEALAQLRECLAAG